MQLGVDGRTVVVKMDQGEEFGTTLQRGLREANATSGIVLGGIGALRDFELGWFDPESREYTTKQYPESHELVSLQGTVSLDADLPLHLHAALAGRDHAVVGGHFYQGTVSVLAEVSVLNLTDIHLTRRENPETGLKELTIEKRGGPG